MTSSITNTNDAYSLVLNTYPQQHFQIAEAINKFVDMDLKDLKKEKLPKAILKYLYDFYDKYKNEIETRTSIEDLKGLLFTCFNPKPTKKLESSLKALIEITDVDIYVCVRDKIADTDLQQNLLIIHKKIRNLAAEALCAVLEVRFEEKKWEICFSTESSTLCTHPNKYFFLYVTKINDRAVISAKTFLLLPHDELSDAIILNPDPKIETCNGNECTVVCFLQSQGVSRTPVIEPLFKPTYILDGVPDEENPLFWEMMHFIKQNKQLPAKELSKKISELLEGEDGENKLPFVVTTTFYNGFPDLSLDFHKHPNAFSCAHIVNKTNFDQNFENLQHAQSALISQTDNMKSAFIKMAREMTQFFLEDMYSRLANRFTQQTTLIFPLTLTKQEWKQVEWMLIDTLSKDVETNLPLLCWLVGELGLEIDRQVLDNYALEEEKAQMNDEEMELSPETMIKCFKYQALTEFLEAKKETERSLQNSNNNNNIHPMLMQADESAKKKHFEKVKPHVKKNHSLNKKPPSTSKNAQKPQSAQSHSKPLPEKLQEHVDNIFDGHPMIAKDFTKLCMDILRSKMKENEITFKQEACNGAHPKIHFRYTEDGRRAGISLWHKHGKDKNFSSIGAQKKTLEHLLGQKK